MVSLLVRLRAVLACTALGCPHECWECLALVASELHAMCWKDPCRVGSRIAGDFVEDELRKMLVDGDPEELPSFGDCSPEGESSQAGSSWCRGYRRCGSLTSWSRRGRRPQTWLKQWVWPRLN